MLIVRTDHDINTHYTYEWCNPLIKMAESKGLKVAEIKPKDVNIKNFKAKVEKLKPSFIFFNGHGSKSAFLDNEKNEFLNCKHANFFKNTITFARSCDSLKELGPKTVEEGCKAFIGYKKEFWIPRLHGMETRPLKDPVAAPVLSSSNIIAEELISGKNVKEAIYKSLESSSQKILDLIHSNDPYLSATLPALFSNHSCLGYEGNGSSKL